MKQLKAFKKFFYILILIWVFFLFYKINDLNYQKEQEIQTNYINHPEDLQNSELAKLTSFWFKNLRADIYRLRTIQYIWWYVIKAEYKKYLYQIISLINDLNPYFEHPYIIWQLLLPDYNDRYENLTTEEQTKYIDEAILIWLKWVKNFCDENKINLIKNENNLEDLWTNSKYENPCKSYKIPFYLAYIYYYYKNDPTNAALYYKISSANKDSVDWAKILAAIMMWKWWDREKSIFMFLTLADGVANEKNENDQTCLKVVNYIKNIKDISSSTTIKDVWNLLVEAFWKFSEKRENDFVNSDTCENYVNKAVREINLLYLDNANKKYFKNTWFNSKNAKELFDKWYIDYIPTDFQQYTDYWIVYKFNPKTGYYDYEMWDY